MMIKHYETIEETTSSRSIKEVPCGEINNMLIKYAYQ